MAPPFSREAPPRDARESRGGPVHSAARPNGLPSESRQIAQRSPGWTTLPSSSTTRSSARARSGTRKYGSEKRSPGMAEPGSTSELIRRPEEASSGALLPFRPTDRRLAAPMYGNERRRPLACRDRRSGIPRVSDDHQTSTPGSRALRPHSGLARTEPTPTRKPSARSRPSGELSTVSDANLTRSVAERRAP